MGWFEDQVNKRKKLDEQTFEDSFKSLAGVHKGKESEDSLRENYALSQVLSFYRHQMGEIPNNITSFVDKMNYALRPFGVEYHKIELSASWDEGNVAPIIAFSKSTHAPVALIPKGNKGYYYINYKTKKKGRVDEAILERLEKEAYRFYRPFPNTKVTIKEYLAYLQRSMRPWETVVAIILSAAVTGVGLLLPYFTKMLTGEVVSDVVASKDYSPFILATVYLLSTATGLLLLKAVQGFVNTHIAIKREKAIEEAMMMRLLSLPPSFYKRFNTGELTSRFDSVSQLASTIINGVFMTLISSAMSLAYLFQIGSFASILVLPVLLILLVSTVFTIAISFLQKNYMKKNLELASKESGVTYEMITGIQKIRLSGSEKRVFAKWANTYSKSAKTRYNPPLLIKLSAAITLLITLLGNIALYLIAAHNKIEVASYMAFVSSYGVLSGALASLSSMAGLFSTIEPLFDMARPILTAEPEATQGKYVVEKVGGEIRFENVCFRYGESSPWILDHLNLDIKEGEYIAIVGPTGCGKSTFVRLLLGFENPNKGTIYYDDHRLEDIDLPSLRKNIGTVMQNGTLFHADILSNIIISAPDMKEEDAWEAAKIADIDKDIKAMPMKMKTVISEGQGGISGGQKQRIMIARAIVHKPKILIFDEATSALDNKTQKSISDSISKLNCTRIVIAHRLSTIKQADRILMLEGGKIIESGDYESLIQKKGRFAELVDRQRIHQQEGDL